MAALLEVGIQIPLEFQAAWYRQTLFDTYHEVHALQLGVYTGILVLSLRTRGYRHVATILTLAMFAFTMGFPDIDDVCRRSGEYCGSLPVQLQPWYFLTGLIGVAIVAPHVAAQLRRAWRWWRAHSNAGRVVGSDQPTRELSPDGGSSTSPARTGDTDD